MTILLIIFFLLLSAFFSGSEIAFISANKLRMEVRRHDNTRKGRILANLYDHPNDFISTMLVGNNIALVIFTYMMNKLLTPLIQPYLGGGFGMSILITLILTIIVLIFGEYLPKIVFREYADKALAVFAYPLQFFRFLLKIPAAIMTVLSSFILKYVFKASSDQIDEPFTRLDLENLIVTASGSDEEDEVDADLFKNALQLNSVKVKECMIPRNEIVTIDKKASISDLRQVLFDSKLSRILVVDDNIEEVKGYVHHQQLLSSPKTISPLIMPLPFVPETMPVTDLLNQFILKHKSLACVVDEYGSVAGIVTMEDILEEIFGDFEDEHDVEDLIEEEINDHTWLFSGRQEIDYLNEKYEDISFPEGDYTTLSGYIVMTMEDIPEQGDIALLGDYQFTFEQVSDTKIDLIRVEHLGNADD